MKSRIAPLTVVAMCLGLPSLAMARPNEDVRSVRDEPGGPRHEDRGDPRHEHEHEHEPMREVPPGGRPLRPMERENAVRYEDHLRREQVEARARRLALIKDQRRWGEERRMRAEAHRRAIALQWTHVSERPAARAELAIHANRMARLNRALDVAESSSDTAMVARINDLIRRENARHARTMAAIEAGVE